MSSSDQRVRDERHRAGAASTPERVYDRIAAVYDVVEAPMDWLGGTARRRRVLDPARGRVLEVGVGTGRNLDLYPPGLELVGIDLSQRMLDRARARARRLGLAVELRKADVEALPFPDGSFDTVTATCVFCSVADPVRGLREVRRVLKPDGAALLLEHVRPRGAVIGRLADLVSPVTRRLVGPELNRRTEENVERAGLRIERVRRDGVWREMVARAARSE